MEELLSWMGTVYTEVTTKVHIERQRNPCQSLDTVVHENTVLDFSAKIFLSNPGPVNMQGFIDLLDEKINAKPRLTAIKCPGDADRSIVETALEVLKLHKPVT